MVTITGKNGIKATILAYSISLAGKHMITWEIEYPRLILAELNTHRQLSRNSFSSRAVPFLKMLEQLTGEPVRFGVNQAGMQDTGVDFDAPIHVDKVVMMTSRGAWHYAKKLAISISRAFYDAGYHKQVYNRLLEPFQMMKTVLSATEVDNFFWLRDDDAADPTLRELARVMKEAKEASTPVLLQSGEWHLPYIEYFAGEYALSDEDYTDGKFISLEDAIKVSCARCAAVSYRNEGYDLAKSLEIYDNLVGGDRKHASAFEHQATPMTNNAAQPRGLYHPHTWEGGVTHMDVHGKFWSGNLQGWLQYRKFITGECYSAG